MERQGRFALRLARVTASRAQAPHARASYAFYSSASDTHGSGAPPANADASAKQQPVGDASAKVATANKKKSTPMQNLKDVMDALDIMIEEAEKKVVKKYRPNMFAEFKQLNDTAGKVIEGPEQLTEVAKAIAFPSLKVKSLAGKDVDLESLVANGSKATLVLTSFKNFGMNMLPAWRNAFEKEFANNNKVQTVTLNIIEDWYMKLVQSSITHGLQEKTPSEIHEMTFAHFGRCDDFRTALDLYNSFTGYAHLVDAKGRIRWIAAGEATPEELKRLMNVTNQLLDQSAQSRRR
uniref:Thioredoxin domain-containing protein n=1 Tax=Globisporangium ultimum (strain ATCC 200006 / CBS 805.95 / DAOM BR144) TaxID=431595 RepID=K3WHR8_GLOUD